MERTPAPVQVIPATLYLAQFRLEVPVMRVPGMGDYFPVRAFCRAIGLPSHTQVEKLQTNSEYANAIETFTIPTSGGPQVAVCLRKREVAYWLGTLETRTIRKLEARFNTTLDTFKQALMDAADVLWWGTGVGMASPEQTLQRTEPTGALTLHCRRCGAQHRLEVAHGTVLWEIDESERE